MDSPADHERTRVVPRTASSLESPQELTGGTSLDSRRLRTRHAPAGRGPAAHPRRRAIEHARGLVGHSDADVVLHAVTDALLGAAGLGDIGDAFPDTDPQWKDADSRLFLRETLATAEPSRAGGRSIST